MTLQSLSALAEIRDSLLKTYASNDAMNQLILSHLKTAVVQMREDGRDEMARASFDAILVPEHPPAN